MIDRSDVDDFVDDMTTHIRKRIGIEVQTLHGRDFDLGASANA